MSTVLWIGLGGAIGSVCRYLSGFFITRLLPSAFPFSTFSINITGAFLIGLISEYSLKASPLSSNLYLFLTVGLMGGFTTFSTFSLETVNLLENGRIHIAFLYIFASLILCLTGVILGKLLVRAVM